MKCWARPLKAQVARLPDRELRTLLKTIELYLEGPRGGRPGDARVLAGLRSGDGPLSVLDITLGEGRCSAVA